MPVTTRDVKSLSKSGSAKLKGDVTLSEGANVTLTQSGQDIAIESAAGGGSGTLTTIKENNVQVGGSDIVTLDFLGADFNLSEDPDTEINISIEDSGIDHDALTNFAANEHFTEASINHANITAGTGADHSYIDQDVTSGSSPTFTGTNFTGIDISTGTNLAVGEGLDLTDDTLSGEDASDTNKGIASFNASDFSVSSGAVTRNFIGCRVTNSSDQSIDHNTSTALTFNTEYFDTDSMHSTVSNTSRITITTAGKYVVGGQVRWAYNNDTGRRNMFILLNGNTQIMYEARPPVQQTNVRTDLTGCTIYNFSASDYIELWVLQNSGGSLDAVSVGEFAPVFWAYRIGP